MRWSPNLVLTAAWIAAGTALYLVEPDAAPFLLPLALVAPIVWSQRKLFFSQVSTLSWVTGTLGLTSAYLLMNACWSPVPSRAYIAAALFAVASAVLHVVARTLPSLEREPLRAMAIGFYAAFAVCALLMSVEIAFDHPFHLRVFGIFPRLAPQMGGVVIEGGFVQKVPSFFLNRNIAALVFLLWPALLIAVHLSGSRTTRAVLLACLLPTIPAVFMSEHETSKLAILGSAVVFCIGIFVPRIAKPILMAGWVIACTAALPLASLAYDLELHRAEWLPMSARHRVVIWDATSARVGEAPILGRGMVSARELGKRQAESPVYAPGTGFQLSPGPHAHNVYLESWLDTGAVGVSLMIGIGLLALGAISRVAADVQPALYATFATNGLLAASSFSLWSRWFLASFALSTIFAMLGWRLAATNPESQGPATYARCDLGPPALRTEQYRSNSSG